MVLGSTDSRLETSIDCICKLVDSENVKIMNKSKIGYQQTIEYENEIQILTNDILKINDPRKLKEFQARFKKINEEYIKNTKENYIELERRANESLQNECKLQMENVELNKMLKISEIKKESETSNNNVKTSGLIKDDKNSKNASKLLSVKQPKKSLDKVKTTTIEPLSTMGSLVEEPALLYYQTICNEQTSTEDLTFTARVPIQRQFKDNINQIDTKALMEKVFVFIDKHKISRGYFSHKILHISREFFIDMLKHPIEWNRLTKKGRGYYEKMKAFIENDCYMCSFLDDYKSDCAKEQIEKNGISSRRNTDQGQTELEATTKTPISSYSTCNVDSNEMETDFQNFYRSSSYDSTDVDECINIKIEIDSD